MNNERLSLDRRAARHAALADPARLRMVDLLAVGDLSPGELRAQLNISSNLLAHHLGVLERENMITRTRSEGDGRRSYIRLQPEAFDGFGPSTAATGLGRIVFVCTGNSARSPMAAAIWHKSSPIPCTSAGTQPARITAPRAIATAKRHGFDLTAHQPRAVGDVIDNGDFVITVCDCAHERLSRSELHWSVPNPGRIGTAAAYEAAYVDLADRIERLLPHLSTD